MLFVALAVTGCGPDPCSPAEQEKARSSDASAVLDGTLSLKAAYDREYERLQTCGQ
ncbi:hypothetical protein H7X46_11385 [Pseudonocardia sp. C8]|uniref:hypothetical protein n=1 Tax=Pseudonocardia sp. C8 TaxID=2762759 RepID=UPI00164247A2|nr:hypothetical protein [Pseudonocardia sp. C8]MBC3191663.1 hypothetical protein [Pseudonocardia sp. C8]